MIITVQNTKETLKNGGWNWIGNPKLTFMTPRNKPVLKLT